MKKLSRGGVTPSVIRARAATRDALDPPPPRAPQWRALALFLGFASILHIVVYRVGLGEDRAQLGTGLALGTLVLAIGVGWSRRVWLAAVLLLVGLAQAATFLLVLAEAPLPFPHRPLLLGILGAYLGAAVLLGGFLLPERMVGLTLVLALLLPAAGWGLEAVATRLASEPEAALPTDPDYRIRYRGALEVQGAVGALPIPNSSIETLYPDNPRGYFRSRELGWALSVQPSSSAHLRSMDDSLEVLIERADDPTPWHIQLTHAGLELVEGAEYILDFRVRATSRREYTFAVSMAHPPWEGLGLYQPAAVGIEWSRVVRTFTASRSDNHARVHFDFGGDTVDVLLSEVVVRRPGRPDVVFDRSTPEYYVSTQWNSHGCRGPEYAIPAPAGTLRILVLGDSYVEGVGVHDEHTFAAVLEHLLRQEHSGAGDVPNFEVVNCGVRGFTTLQQRFYYEERVRAYQPDLVIAVLSMEHQPPATAETEGPARWRSLLRMSDLIESIRPRLRPADFAPMVSQLAQLRASVRDDGAELAIVAFRKGESRDWDRLLQALDATGASSDVPILDLYAALSGYEWESTLAVHPLDAHPNERAHRIVAETMHEWLEREGLIRADPAGR